MRTESSRERPTARQDQGESEDAAEAKRLHPPQAPIKWILVSP